MDIKLFPFSLINTDYERGDMQANETVYLWLICCHWPAVCYFPSTNHGGTALCIRWGHGGCRYIVWGILFFESPVIGIVCIIHGAESIGPMGTTWAIIGIRKASKSLSRTIQAVQAQTTFIAAFVEFLIRLVFFNHVAALPNRKI